MELRRLVTARGRLHGMERDAKRPAVQIAKARAERVAVPAEARRVQAAVQPVLRRGQVLAQGREPEQGRGRRPLLFWILQAAPNGQTARLRPRAPESDEDERRAKRGIPGQDAGACSACQENRPRTPRPSALDPFQCLERGAKGAQPCFAQAPARASETAGPWHASKSA